MTESTLHIMQAIKEVVVTLSAVAGVMFAWLGLSKWRQELRGRTEFDLARRVLVAVYKVRDAIVAVRNPWLASVEWADRPNRQEHESGSASAEDIAHAYDKRWRPLLDAHNALTAELPEAEAVWGDVLAEPMKALDLQLKTLWFQLFRRYLYGLRYPDFWERLSLTDRDKAHAIVWSMADASEDDEFGRSVTAAVEKFDEVLRSHLRRRR